jgi:hypothetical protein
MPPTLQVCPLAVGQTVNLGVTLLLAALLLMDTLTLLAAPPAGQIQIAKLAVPPGCTPDLVLMGCTFRQSWTEGLLPVGLGDGLLEPEPVGLGEGEAEPEGLLLGLLLGLDEALLLGVDVALLVALGVDVALLVALGVLLAVALLVAFAVALALALAEVLAEALEDALALAEGDGEETEAASRTIADWPAGTLRAAEAAAGGWPHTLGADALTALTSVALAVLASAAVPPRKPMLEVTMAAPATMPNADDADRADFMAAPSSPWSSPSRPRVSCDPSDRPCAETIPCCPRSTPAPSCPSREHRSRPGATPEYSVWQGQRIAMS